MDRTDTSPTRHPRFSGAVKSAGRSILTLGVIAAALGTGAAGYAALAARAAGAPAPAAAPLTTVAPEPLRLESTVRLVRGFAGQVDAAQEVSLAFEEGGTLEEIRVREGDAVEAGDVVARLDTRLLEAERARLRSARAALAAEAELARRTDDRARALAASGHATAQRRDETALRVTGLEASLAELDAALDAVDVRLAKAEIRAPFAGRIGARLLDAGAMARPGASIATLTEAAPSRFRAGLDPDLAGRLAPGTEVVVDIAGRSLTARLSGLAPGLDPVTRTRTAWFDLPEGPDLPARSAGTVRITDAHDATGAWVPLSALRQGPRGSWTLMVLGDVVGDTAKVGLEAVEILHLDAGRAFVRGALVSGVRYLPAGAHRVVPGQDVAISEDAS